MPATVVVCGSLGSAAATAALMELARHVAKSSPLLVGHPAGVFVYDEFEEAPAPHLLALAALRHKTPPAKLGDQSWRCDWRAPQDLAIDSRPRGAAAPRRQSFAVRHRSRQVRLYSGRRSH